MLKNSREKCAYIVERYYKNPTPENGEEVLKLFAPLIGTYMRLFTTGQYSSNGRRLPGLSNFLRIINPSIFPRCFGSYDYADLRQEVKLCILEEARQNGNVTRKLHFRMKQLFRRLTKDRVLKVTDYHDTQSEEISENPMVALPSCHFNQDLTSIEILDSADISIEEKFLLYWHIVEGYNHDDTRHLYNQKFGKRLSRRWISELISIALEKFRAFLINSGIYSEYRDYLHEPNNKNSD
jgi:hypothetical protein